MFTVESLGIRKQGDLFNYDEQMVERFQRSNSFKDNKYYVQLPWDSDKISYVLSNHSVALHVLDHVPWRLEYDQLYLDYLKVFCQQEHDRIIEEIFIPSQQLKEYIWIPHKHVLKSDPASTTKIQPVFNCTLKTNDSFP